MRALQYLTVLTSLCISLCLLEPVRAQSSIFTYQGQLKEAGRPADGSYNLTFKLFDSLGGVGQVGPPIPRNGVVLTNGLFSETLDFGAGVFSGAPRWLEVSVNGNALTPRQAITPAPYALYALGGPGGPGHWQSSGTNIFNTNTGNVGIGRNPTYALDVRATSGLGVRLGLDGNGGGALILANNTGDNRIYLEGFNSTNNGSAEEMLLTGFAGGFIPKLTLRATNTVAEGNVGIGTPDPQMTLDIVSPQHALRMSGNGPDVTFRDTARGNARNVIQSVGGDLNLFTESYMSGANPRSFLKVANSGNVGIGNPVPQMTLDIVSPQHALAMTAFGPDVTFYDTGHGFARSVIQSVGGDLNLFTESYMSGVNSSSFLKVANNGNVGVGTATPGFKLDVAGRIRLRQGSNSAGLWLYQTAPAADRAFVGMVDDSHVGFYGNSGAGWGLTMDTTTGRVSVPVLEIRGGADLAEPFDVSGSAVEPGMVVVIDADQPGNLKLSAKAYDRTVAGVISGAGGIQTGMVMGQQDSVADGSQKVALTGRVYCKCDASYGAIEPGDLLTTSETRGHAMKASDRERSHGAVLGKAMTTLAQGERGLVLVLVNLQ